MTDCWNQFIRRLPLMLSIVAGSLPGLQVCAAEGVRPNVLIIICDDLNDSVEGMGGHPQAKTPHIDRLAQAGVRFTNAACNVPLCGPSRASLWSGLLPTTTGFYGYKQQLNQWGNNPVLKTSKTVFEHCVAHGYRSFATGKIHHNGHEDLGIFRNPDGFPGFGTEGNFGPLPNDGKPENKRHGILPPWMPEGLRGKTDWGAGYGPIQDLGPGDQHWTLFYSGTRWKFDGDEQRDPMPDEIHADEAISFLGRDHAKPFLLTVGFSRPHSPWYAPREYFDMFPLEDVRLTPLHDKDSADCARILVEDQDIPSWGWKKFNTYRENGGRQTLREWTQAYLACVAFVDDQTGRVLEALGKSSHAQNTLVIFTSDHGYHMGEKDYLFKNSPWEESARIPLVVAGPDVAAGKECSTPVSLVDLYPTVVDYAGIPEPHALDGNSLRPLLKDPAKGAWSGRPYSVTAVASKVDVPIDTPAAAANQHFSLRTESHRYIRCRNGEEELYDHRNDPNEWHNLAGREKSRESLMHHRRILTEFLEGATQP